MGKRLDRSRLNFGGLVIDHPAVGILQANQATAGVELAAAGSTLILGFDTLTGGVVSLGLALCARQNACGFTDSGS